MQLTIPDALKMAVGHHKQGQLERAEELYRLILSADPDEADALAMLGTLMSQKGFHDDGLNLIERAISLKPEAADFHANHGLILFAAGQTDAAVRAYEKAIALRPDIANAHYNLGNALLRRGDIHEAIDQYNQAIQLNPTDSHAYCNLGTALLRQEKIDEAMAAFRKAIECQPDYAEAMSNIGSALLRQRKLDEATQWFRKASDLRPQVAEIACNLAGALKDSGQLEQALICYRRALGVRPDPIVHSNLCYLLQFHPDFEPRAIAMELNRWNQAYAAALGKDVQMHANYSVRDRRLKVGYVSPYLRSHAEAHFLLPLLEAHHRDAVEVHCFSTTKMTDECTDRHRAAADIWHDARRDDDADLAKRIREAQIDVLVDLTMHMGENRLLTFARKPAPVQVAWLAYPGSTGLTAMDCRLTDSIMDPSNRDDSIYSEKSVRLPGCWVCYDPLSDQPTRSPDQRGPVTFGSLNNPCKINPRTLRVWTRILREVPESRLILLCVSDQQRVQIRRLFDEAQIKGPRIDFVTTCSRDEYLRQYDGIDIALDPWPYNGITTTCDALWMGVPVITHTGPTAASRAGASVLTAANFAELIGDSPDRFVKIAVDLARDTDRLINMRATLRERITQSPLMDHQKFAADIEAAYREMWIHWCTQFEARTV